MICHFFHYIFTAENIGKYLKGSSILGNEIFKENEKEVKVQ